MIPTNPKGGVGVYVNNKHQYKGRPDLSVFIANIFESIFIELEIGKNNIIIGTIYRPNTYPHADLDIFMYNMNELFSLLAAEKKVVYIMGDFNIDMLKLKEHNKTSVYIENLFSHGYLPLITKPTRVTDHSATLIDHIYTNKQTINATSGIIITDISDHFGIFSTIQHAHIKSLATQKSKLVRLFSDHNIKNFNNVLRQSDFTSVLNHNNANLAYNSFLDIYKEAYDLAFPLKEIRLIKKYNKRSPWITKGLVNSSITKSKLLKSKLKIPSIEKKIAYTNFCGIYNKLLRKAKVLYFSEQFELAKYNMRKSWNLLRTAINKQSAKDILPSSFKYNNTLITDAKEIADNFNNFFVNIGWELSNNIANTDTDFATYLDPPNQYSMFFDPIDANNILDIVKNIKSKTSMDNNNISTNLLKKSIVHITEPLSHIINISLSTGVFPEEMKVAKVIPIFKSGDNTVFNNYRPISLLPIFSKILEKIVAKKIENFLNDTKQFNMHQFGFRANHSTVHPIIHLLNQIAEQNDKPCKNLTMTTFLDLSKAFDTISHKILLKKLYNMGLRGVANTWFCSYLTNRKQYMIINDNKSSLETIKCGVPQGSILGPILFIIYINDIHNSTFLKLLCFADDTTCCYSASNLTNLFHTMNTELAHLSTWIKANKLCLNTKKTKFMIFGPTVVRDINHTINIDNNIIERVGKGLRNNVFKCLGIYMDETLNWKDHINKICSKISHSNYILNKVKNIIPKSCLLTLYRSIIHCHINYGLITWGASSGIDRVFKLQKKAICIINMKPYNYHTDPLFKENKILKIIDQYFLDSVIFMHKIKSKCAPISFQELNYFTLSQRPTRYPNMAKCRKSRTKFSSNLPIHKLPQMWNQLSLQNRDRRTINMLKSSVKAKIYDNYSAYVRCTNSRCKQCFPTVL